MLTRSVIIGRHCPPLTFKCMCTMSSGIKIYKGDTYRQENFNAYNPSFIIRLKVIKQCKIMARLHMVNNFIAWIHGVLWTWMINYSMLFMKTSISSKYTLLKFVNFHFEFFFLQTCSNFSLWLAPPLGVQFHFIPKNVQKDIKCNLLNKSILYNLFKI
jgi:hypothetical protein